MFLLDNMILYEINQSIKKIIYTCALLPKDRLP